MERTNTSSLFFAVFMVVSLLCTFLTFSTSPTSFVENTPVEKTQDPGSNNNLVEENVEHMLPFASLPLVTFHSVPHQIQFPTHLNLTPFLLIDELIKPPSLS